MNTVRKVLITMTVSNSQLLTVVFYLLRVIVP